MSHLPTFCGAPPSGGPAAGPWFMSVLARTTWRDDAVVCVGQPTDRVVRPLLASVSTGGLTTGPRPTKESRHERRAKKRTTRITGIALVIMAGGMVFAASGSGDDDRRKAAIGEATTFSVSNGHVVEGNAGNRPMIFTSLEPEHRHGDGELDHQRPRRAGAR